MRLALLLFFIVGLLVLLAWQFPYAVGTVDEKMRIVYLVSVLLLVGGGSGMLRRVSKRQAMRDAALWLGIIVALVLGYSFRNDIKHSRLAGELIPARIQTTADGGLSVTMATDGHFHIEAEVDGALLYFLIDTGASDIVLSKQDAARAGFDVDTLNYSRTYSTANGLVSGAPVRIRTMNIGSLTLHDLPASVGGGNLDSSLLGMSFLKQFSRYSVDGNRLTLIP